MSESAASHRKQAGDDRESRTVPCAVLTISDTRTVETDRSGALIADLLVAAGHAVAAREIVPDDPAPVRERLEAWLGDPAIRVVLSSGGTGIALRDRTPEIVRPLLTEELPGFGELFRVLSHRSIGASAMLSRAIGGLAAREPEDGGDTFIFAMPGSTNAVETAMRELILPELGHLVWLRRTS